MAQTSITIRIDEARKKEFDRICAEFGMSISTAFNMFVKATLRSQSIPFPIESDKKEMVRKRAIEAIRKIREQSAKRPEITLDEINAEIEAVRNGEKEDAAV